MTARRNESAVARGDGMKDWSWTTMVELPADQAQQEPDASCVPGSCPCSCLRSMVRVLDAVSTEQAVLEAQAALGDVTGKVLLSVYRRVCLLYTSPSPRD